MASNAEQQSQVGGQMKTKLIRTSRALLAAATAAVLLVPAGATPSMAAGISAGNLVSARSIATSLPASSCLSPHTNGRSDVSIGKPLSSGRAPSTGVVNYVVLFVDFPALASTRTTRSLASVISPKSEREFAVESYGKLQMKYTFHHKWLRMPNPASDYTFTTFEGQREYVQDAIKLADSAVDFSKADGVLVLTDPSNDAFAYGPAFTAQAGFGIMADGKEIRNGATNGSDLTYWGSRWANHEIGHNFGLPDLYAYQGIESHRFVGDFSFMGLINGKAPSLFAYEKWVLNWIRNGQVICEPELGKVHTISSLQRKSGKKLILVPLGGSRQLAIEYRTASNLDRMLGRPGLVVYVVDSGKESGNGPIEVVSRATGSPTVDSTLIRVGKSIKRFGYRIKLVSVVGQNARVEIRKN